MCNVKNPEKSVFNVHPNGFQPRESYDNRTYDKKNLEDTLAKITGYLREVLKIIADVLEKFPLCKVFTTTTQLAHFITILAVTGVAFLFYPQTRNLEAYEKQPSVALAFFYLACYGIHLGTQFWMTFMSGLSLYFSLPRHTFGSVQKVLFPRYFSINSLLSCCTMISFLKNTSSEFDEAYIKLQGINLAFCFLLELLIALYLTPPLISLITEKTAMEAANGLGFEIGKHVPGNLINCPHYVKIYKKFRKVHTTIAMGNMITMACSVFHLHYLAHKICTAAGSNY